MAYTTYFEERSCCADFANVGYRLFFVNTSFTKLPINSVSTGFSPFRIGVFENEYTPDYSEFEREVYRILRAAPDAVIFPRIYVSMPKWWIESHPEDVTLTPKGGYRETLFSNSYREDGARLLEQFIDHVKNSDYAYSIGGWQICGGQTQEWFHHDLYGSLNNAAISSFGQWKTKKHKERDTALPSKEDFVYRGSGENTSENAILYSLFCNEEVAATVDHFARVIKEATDHSQIVGTFYGYSFESCDTALMGSHALRCLIDSPNVDFLSSPNSYHGNRKFGIDWVDMMPVDSIKLHGKLCFIECDVRTHLTRAIQDVRPGEYADHLYRTSEGDTVWVGPPSAELSLCALRKCLAHQLSKGSAIWWFDMWGGWYDDPSLMKELTDMKHLCDNGSTRSGKSPRCEVVFFADERGYSRLFNASPQLRGIHETRLAMGNTGVPYDSYMSEDAANVLENYKAAVFPMPIPSEAGQRAMEFCEKMNIPYITATKEHCSLTVKELCDFYKSCGVHFYTEEKDVVYLGNGYLGLHSAVGGKKRLILPEKCRVSAIFEANAEEQTTDVIEFDLKENRTALFYFSRTDSQLGEDITYPAKS
jgi:beta-galactosidase